MEVGKIRIGGAQIPITRDVSKNLKTIKEAIDWASEINVDYLVTPEGSLSGYTVDWKFDVTELALREIEQYSKEKNVGLCLGTLWKENTNIGIINRNQIRFYQDGQLFGVTNKSHVIEHDNSLGHNLDKEGVIIHCLRKNNSILPVVGLICNDMWGHSWLGGKCIVNEAQQTKMVDLLIHSTNGTRGNEEDQYFDLWHDTHFRLLSRASGIPIFTVDNSIHMEGDQYDGKTSSESGVIYNGEWLTAVPRTGTQYFYYDFPCRYIST